MGNSNAALKSQTKSSQKPWEGKEGSDDKRGTQRRGGILWQRKKRRTKVGGGIKPESLKSLIWTELNWPMSDWQRREYINIRE